MNKLPIFNLRQECVDNKNLEEKIINPAAKFIILIETIKNFPPPLHTARNPQRRGRTRVAPSTPGRKRR